MEHKGSSTSTSSNEPGSSIFTRSTIRELAAIAAVFLGGLLAGSVGQSRADQSAITQSTTHAAEQRIGTMFQTPRGDNWVLAHVYMPECARGHRRVVEAPERDEADYLAVYCWDGDEATKDELAAMAGVQ